jgi:transcription elongation GreA/GreB family factor
MDKQTLQQLLLDRLRADLQVAIDAARIAHAAATDEESKAENKYDTRGLEAAYLAAGQSRRVEELRQALQVCQNLVLRPFDAQVGIQLGALLELEDEQGSLLMLFLMPAAAGIKLAWQGRDVLLISPQAPLGQRLLGKGEGDDVQVQIGARVQRYEVLSVC